MAVDLQVKKVKRRHGNYENDVEDEMDEELARGRGVEQFGLASPYVPVKKDGRARGVCFAFCLVFGRCDGIEGIITGDGFGLSRENQSSQTVTTVV